MNRRNDYKMALLVEGVIHDTLSGGHIAAARHLADLGVPLEVAIRVLTRPAERRVQVAPPDEVRRMTVD